MPKPEPVDKQVQQLLDRQHALLDELRSLAPRECYDVDHEDWRLTFWRSALLTVNETLEPLDDLALDLKLHANQGAAATKVGENGRDV